MMNLAQVSWGSRLSADYGERARIFGWWTAVNVFGTMAVLFVPPIVTALDATATPGDGIRAMGWSIIAAVPLVVALAVLLVPEGEAPAGSHRVTLRDVRDVLRDPRMVRLLVVDLFLSMAGGLTGALFLFFFTAARGLAPGAASQLLLFYFVAGLAAAPIWVRLAKRYGKHRATAYAGIVAALSMLLVVLLPAEPFWIPAVAMALAGLPFAAPAFLLRAMMADLNDAQLLDRRTGGGRETETTGLNFAILTATQKLGYAIPVGLTYPILGAIGFDPRPGAANSAGAILGLELLFVAPPAVLAAAASLIIWRWPITAEAHALIRSSLAARPSAVEQPLPVPVPSDAPPLAQAP
jgi:Na+/melibiose symporter-like transporter